MSIENQCNGVHIGVSLVCYSCHEPKCQSKFDGKYCMLDLFHEGPHENPYSDLSWDDPDYTPKKLTDEEIAGDLEWQTEMNRLNEESHETYRKETTKYYNE